VTLETYESKVQRVGKGNRSRILTGEALLKGSGTNFRHPHFQPLEACCCRKIEPDPVRRERIQGKLGCNVWHRFLGAVQGPSVDIEMIGVGALVPTAKDGRGIESAKIPGGEPLDTVISPGNAHQVLTRRPEITIPPIMTITPIETIPMGETWAMTQVGRSLSDP